MSSDLRTEVVRIEQGNAGDIDTGLTDAVGVDVARFGNKDNALEFGHNDIFATGTGTCLSNGGQTEKRAKQNGEGRKAAMHFHECSFRTSGSIQDAHRYLSPWT